MAQETKVGLLIGLALILLVGLLLSDLITGPTPEFAEASASAQFGQQAQNSIYEQPADHAGTLAGESAGHDYGYGTPSPRQLDQPLPSIFEQADPTADPYQLDHPVQTQSPGMPAPGTPSPAPRSGFPEPSSLEARDPAASLVELPSAWHVATREGAAVSSLPESVEPLPDASTFIPPVIDRVPSEITARSEAASQPPTQADPQPALPDLSQTQFVHFVEAGQTLTDIARQHYGNPEFARAIALTNRDKLDAEGHARPGTRLDIPPLNSPVFSRLFEPVHADHAAKIDDTAPAMPGRDRSMETPKPKIITVEAGDTLSGLASKHLGGAGRWDQIIAANPTVLTRPEELRSGMKLVIPTPGNNTGNDPHAAPESAKGLVPPGTPAPHTYTVVAGDNLTQIARKQLGDGDRWRDLYEANRDLLASPESVRVGMKLKLPTPAPAPGNTASESAHAAPESAKGLVPAPAPKTYTVVAGDNLTQIARKHLGSGDRWDELFEANRDQLDAPESLRVGMTLRLP